MIFTNILNYFPLCLLNSNFDFSYLVKKSETLDPNIDLNTVTESGIYYLSGSVNCDNRPTSLVTNCYLLVFWAGVNRCAQIMLPGNDEHIYYRSKATDRNEWYKWKTTN